MSNRKGEDEKKYFRTERVFSTNGDWFFSTREGLNIGPYPNKEACIQGLERFIQCIAPSADGAKKDIKYAIKIARQGVWDSTLLH